MYWSLIRQRCRSMSTVSSFSLKSPISENEIRSTFEEQLKEKFLKRIGQVQQSKHHLLVQSKSTSSVLVPICIVDNKYSLLYTKRSSNLMKHSGEVSFPGGKMDDEDKSLVDAALRETKEEIGLDPGKVEVWGTLFKVQDRQRKNTVTPVVGFVGNLDQDNLNINQCEVADVFALPFTHLLEAKNQGFTRFKNGWQLPVFLNGPYRVWGLTAVITDAFLANLFPYHYQLKVNRHN